MLILILCLFFLLVLFHVKIIPGIVELQRLEGITRSPIFAHFDQTLLGLATIRTAGGQEEFKRKLIEKVKNNTTSFYTCKMAKMWFLQRMDWIGAAVTIVATI